LCACEMLLPNCGPLPQTSHTCAIVLLQIPWYFVSPWPAPRASLAARPRNPAVAQECATRRLAEVSVYRVALRPPRSSAMPMISLIFLAILKGAFSRARSHQSDHRYLLWVMPLGCYFDLHLPAWRINR
jgi:hypothetical protein